MSSAETGRLQVITGPMFAGKSEELMRRVRRAQLAGQAVQAANHALDSRSGIGALASHAGTRIESAAVGDVGALVEAVGARRLNVLAIDEAQFFGEDLVPAVGRWMADGITVMVAGLCVTYDARPFEPLPALMALAEDVTKLTAVCTVCGRDAAFHQRIVTVEADALVADATHVGGTETYQARCRRHLKGLSP